MKQVLITGGTGFFGRSVLDYFSRHPGAYRFTLLSRHALTPGDKILSQAEHIACDVRDLSAIPPRFDVILHFASPLLGMASDEETERTILQGTQAVARLAQASGATLLFASSGVVYGPSATPISEEMTPAPTSGYGRAKLASERYFQACGLEVKIARCFSFIGPFLPRSAHFAIGNFIDDALAGREITIRGDGSPRRAYLYADDLVEWLFAILERGECARPYNVGSDQALSILDLAHLVRDTLHSSSAIRILGGSGFGAAPAYIPSIARARAELGLSPRVALADAILKSAR